MKRKILAIVAVLCLLFSAAICKGLLHISLYLPEYFIKGVEVTLFILVLLIVCYSFYCYDKSVTLRFSKISIENNNLVLRDKKGSSIVEILCDKPYFYKIISCGYPNSIFKVWQGDKIIEFSTKTNNAEEIARLFLKYKGEYPPSPKWSIPF